MPGINDTGAPQTRDYTLGRGIVRLASLTAAGLPDSDGFRDLGNAVEFNITVEAEDLKHQSSRTQLKFTDARVTLSQEVGMSMILDEMNFQNLSDFFSGTTEVYNNPHDVTFLATAASVSTSIKVGNWYALLDASTVRQRVYNLDATGVVYDFVLDPSGVATSLSSDDYELDEEMGLIRFLSTGTNTLADGDDIGWAISTGATTPNDLDQANALTKTDVVGSLLFIQMNAQDGANKTEYVFHKVSLTADGDLPLIGEDWMQASFNGVAQANSGVSDTSQVLTIRTYDQQA